MIFYNLGVGGDDMQTINTIEEQQFIEHYINRTIFSIDEAQSIILKKNQAVLTCISETLNHAETLLESSRTKTEKIFCLLALIKYLETKHYSKNSTWHMVYKKTSSKELEAIVYMKEALINRLGVHQDEYAILIQQTKLPTRSDILRFLNDALLRRIKNQPLATPLLN